MLIKLKLSAVKKNNVNSEDNIDDPVLRNIYYKNNNINPTEIKIIPAIINIIPENILEIIPSFDGKETQLGVVDALGEDATYMIAEEYDLVIEKLTRVLNLDIKEL